MFSVMLHDLPRVVINPYEHSEFRWVSPQEALALPLVHDLAESIVLFYGNQA